MSRGALARAVALALGAALVLALIWLDRHRAGPANAMARCNLLLARAEAPAADALLIGSSRLGMALDPVAAEEILSAERGAPVRVERLAIGSVPLRAMDGLLEDYLAARGAPRVVALEVMLMSRRSMARLAARGHASPEAHLHRRDVNLLTFRQLLTQPAVAMPFTRAEGFLALWSHRLRGALLRAGALVYEAARHPLRDWRLSACGDEDWTREPTWPADFAFGRGAFEPDAPLDALIAELRAEVARAAEARGPSAEPAGGAEPDPYAIDAPWRAGEAALLQRMARRARRAGAEVVLLPLPLRGRTVDAEALRAFAARLGDGVEVFDLYGALGVDIGPLWRDDAHVELRPVGALATAVMARRLLSALDAAEAGSR